MLKFLTFDFELILPFTTKGIKGTGYDIAQHDYKQE
jgi:hypothetical protein